MAKNKINLSYIAGFFDGEGYITFSKVRKYNPMMKKRYLCTTIRMEATNTDMEDGEKYIHQCWDCDSEGEYYVTTNDNLIGDTDCDDDIIEWMRSLPV